MTTDATRPAKGRIRDCPHCGGKVEIRAHEGGRGSGNVTQYMAECQRPCQFTVQYLGKDTGRLAVAISEWNGMVRRKEL